MPVGPKRGDLDRLPIHHDEADTELDADRNRARKQGLHCVGAGVGRHVEIFGGDAEQAVTHAAAGEIGGVTVAPQRLDDHAGGALAGR